MSAAFQVYVATLLVYFAVNTIACWSFNLQFGVSGLMNFGFIMFQACGAYIAGVLVLGPASGQPEQQWILGAHLPWPVPLLAATVAGALLALFVGLFALRPQRRDFQAVIFLVVALVALTMVTGESSWFNGSEGLYGVAAPFASKLNLSQNDYGWFFVGLSAVAMGVIYFVVDRITGSPWGRRMRAARENPQALESLGTNLRAESLKMFVIGGGIAAFSGGLFVEFISAWSPGGWSLAETFVYMIALIVGGLGNNFGVMLGAFLVDGVFLEVPQFLPTGSLNGTTATAIEGSLIAVLGMAFLYARPRGIVPERRRRLAAIAARELGVRGLAVPAAVVGASGGNLGRAMSATSPTVELPGLARDDDGASPPLTPAVEVHDLVCEFGGLRAVDGLAMVIPQGEVTGLIGPNGAGKSTLLHMIAGAVKPTSGRVLIDGRNVAGWPEHRIARLGVVRTFQHTSEFPRLTVLENLLVASPNQPGDSFSGAMLGRRYARKRQHELLADAYQLLKEFNLEGHADSYAGELSGGQRRLVEIMRALMAHPKILLLDEPMAGVNPGLRPLIEDHLLRLAESNLTMLMVEHELAAVERVCASVLVMAEGRLLASGTMSDLRQNEEVISAYLVG